MHFTLDCFFVSHAYTLPRVVVIAVGAALETDWVASVALEVGSLNILGGVQFSDTRMHAFWKAGDDFQSIYVHINLHIYIVK